MGIKIPAYRLISAKDLPELRKRLRGGGRHRKIDQELTLTSMIDIMSIVILFLIQSFSATGEIMVIAENIRLPEAEHAKILERSPIITITKDVVTLEGYQVGDNQNINEKVTDTDWSLPQLTQKLTDYKTFYESILQGEIFPGRVIVQADRELEFIYLKRVMYSLAKLGFGNVNLAVRGEATPAVVSDPKSDSVPETSSQ